jgi:hypothetical protein
MRKVEDGAPDSPIYVMEMENPRRLQLGASVRVLAGRPSCENARMLYQFRPCSVYLPQTTNIHEVTLKKTNIHEICRR